MALPVGEVSVRLPGPYDLSALVLSRDGKIAGDADSVFVNQPSAPGVRLEGDGVSVEPGRLRRGAERVVVVASPEVYGRGFDRHAPPVATLTGRAGTLARLLPPPLNGETVLQIAEIYRRDGSWRGPLDRAGVRRTPRT